MADSYKITDYERKNYEPRGEHGRSVDMVKGHLDHFIKKHIFKGESFSQSTKNCILALFSDVVIGEDRLEVFVPGVFRKVKSIRKYSQLTEEQKKYVNVKIGKYFAFIRDKSKKIYESSTSSEIRDLARYFYNEDNPKSCGVVLDFPSNDCIFVVNTTPVISLIGWRLSNSSEPNNDYLSFVCDKCDGSDLVDFESTPAEKYYSQFNYFSSKNDESDFAEQDDIDAAQDFKNIWPDVDSWKDDSDDEKTDADSIKDMADSLSEGADKEEPSVSFHYDANKDESSCFNASGSDNHFKNDVFDDGTSVNLADLNLSDSQVNPQYNSNGGQGADENNQDNFNYDSQASSGLNNEAEGQVDSDDKKSGKKSYGFWIFIIVLLLLFLCLLFWLIYPEDDNPEGSEPVNEQENEQENTEQADEDSHDDSKNASNKDAGDQFVLVVNGDSLSGSSENAGSGTGDGGAGMPNGGDSGAAGLPEQNSSAFSDVSSGEYSSSEVVESGNDNSVGVSSETSAYDTSDIVETGSYDSGEVSEETYEDTSAVSDSSESSGSSSDIEDNSSSSMPAADTEAQSGIAENGSVPETVSQEDSTVQGTDAEKSKKSDSANAVGEHVVQAKISVSYRLLKNNSARVRMWDGESELCTLNTKYSKVDSGVSFAINQQDAIKNCGVEFSKIQCSEVFDNCFLLLDSKGWKISVHSLGTEAVR